MASFFCTYCQVDINLESMGKTAITQHQTNKKHIAAVKSKAQNQTMQEFTGSKSAPTPIDLKVAAAEGFLKSGLRRKRCLEIGPAAQKMLKIGPAAQKIRNYEACGAKYFGKWSVLFFAWDFPLCTFFSRVMYFYSVKTI